MAVFLGKKWTKCTWRYMPLLAWMWTWEGLAWLRTILKVSQKDGLGAVASTVSPPPLMADTNMLLKARNWYTPADTRHICSTSWIIRAAQKRAYRELIWLRTMPSADHSLRNFFPLKLQQRHALESTELNDYRLHHHFGKVHFPGFIVSTIWMIRQRLLTY